MEHNDWKELSRAVAALPEPDELLRCIAGGRCPVSVSGLSPVHRAMVAAALRLAAERPLVLLCADEGEARRMAEDLRALTGEEAALLLGREWRLRDRVTASHSLEQQRLCVLCAMAAGRTPVLVATAEAVLQRTLPPSALLDAVLTLRVGERRDLGELARRLDAAGYARSEQVEGMGQFAVRGGILDVWPPLSEPVRMEFFDDEIDAMGVFDAATQRRVRNIESLVIPPASEVLPDAAEGGREALLQRLLHAEKQLARRKGAEKAVETLRADRERFAAGASVGGMDRYLAACYPGAVSALDYLPADTLVLLSDAYRVAERVKSFLWEQSQDTEPLLETGELCGLFAEVSLSQEALIERLSGHPVIQLNALPTSRDLLPPRTLLSMNVKQLPSYGGSLETAAADMRHYTASGYGVLVLCGSETRCKNFLRLLEERDIRARSGANAALPRPGEVAVGLGALSAGAEIPQLRLAILTEGQLTAPAAGRKTPARHKKESSRQKLQSYADLSPGDLVVHEQHGIGRFVGIERIRMEGVERDYIKLAYAGGDSLYVPATQLDLVSKYIGGGGEDENGAQRARLNKLGGTEWNRARSKAKAAAKDLAKGLIALYAERQRRPGFAFSPDSPWQREFEDDFDYEETEDQLRAVEDIKADMERPVPMDRLLCGDVGYGKTEVALRAAMKCILDGKQAAILVPTTVLAQQHYATALSRFRSFPVRIESISRFKTPAEKKSILNDAADGKIDLLIGTHALLQKKVRFKDLGLLIIDEEQRFGVTHKERLRTMARQVDTLTLSATPIPRTLNMALSGLRDMSTIETPPEGRQPVQTYVLEHDWNLVCDAIRRELARGGQVYYLHNRVDSIERCAARLREQLGEETGIAIAHGSLDERSLSAVMQDMESGAVQVLVCTTIIETGIDIPNVNTLVIEDADRMGLSQLHQLRGRIGRSARRAYAYLTYQPGKILSEVATKRLAAIREYAEFGSGFRIAMRDLEIRGAGNLLGPEQSGYMMSVGYDMYLQLLEEAVLEERGEKKTLRAETSADLLVSANLPESYISSPEQRMDLYRRIAALRTPEDSRDLLDELMDRFGDPPKPVLALLNVALLRTAAAEVGVREVAQRGETVTFSFGDAFPAEAVIRLCSSPKNRRRLTLSAGAEPKLSLRLAPGEDALDSALELVSQLHG